MHFIDVIISVWFWPVRKKAGLILRRLGGFELELQFVSNQGDELRIRRLALGVAHRVAKEALQGVEIAPVPGDLDGVADGSLHSAWGGAEVFGHLRIENFGDCIACLTARWGATKACCVPFWFIAFFIVPYLTTLRV